MNIGDEKLLHKSDHSEISLVTDESGNEFVRKTGHFNIETLAAIANIDSPYIAKIVSYSESQIIMEYISGKPLSEVAVPQAQLYEVLCEICSGLSALHTAGIIHRDIKPSNIILADDGHIKIIDYDAARIKKLDADKDTSFIGTDGFAPPEQYGFMQTDERSDIYALGVTIKLLLRDKYESSALRSVAERCMRFDPDKRYKSVERIKTAIKLKRHRTAIIIFSAVLFAIGVFTGVMISQNKGKDIPVSEPTSILSDTTTTTSPETTTASETTAETTEADFSSSTSISENSITETDNTEVITETSTTPVTTTDSPETTTTGISTISETTTASETTSVTTQSETTDTTFAVDPVMFDLSFVPEGIPSLPEGISNVDDSNHVKKVVWEQLDQDTAYRFIETVTEWLGKESLAEDNFTKLGRTVQWKCTDRVRFNGYVSVMYVEDTEKNSMFPQFQITFSEIEDI